ncbi:MAG: alpha/beta hydrolase [Rhodocyclaceae bacterium]|nr:alpha/beta hydrolase [Rhodocyclaceae bacterium]
MHISANKISLAVDDMGGTASPAVLLIMGLGMQLTHWPTSLVDMLLAAGYRVIRFDNRDIGLSTHFDHLGVPSLPKTLLRQRLGLKLRPPYTVEDMARDALGLLDALGIEQAHVVGVSMGGMIAQRLALLAPRRLLSLTSIMSSSGARGLPGPSPRVSLAMMRRPTSADLASVVEYSLSLFQIIGSPGLNDPEQVVRERIARNFQRSYHPAGTARQMVAILADTKRAGELHRIRVPTLVIHGKRDPLVPFACGVDTARRIPHAHLFAVAGMGHNLPQTLVPTVGGALRAHFEAAIPLGRGASATPSVAATA